MLIADSLYIRRSRCDRPRARLVCVPYAGAGASIFTGWPDLLPEDVELLAVQLPGREDRAREPQVTDLDRLVKTVAHALRPYLGQPMALFGHCGGGLLAFELAVELSRRFGVAPARLFVSAQAAPFLAPRNPAIHDLPPDDFRHELDRLDGAPPEVLADDDLMAYLTSVLRADFRLWETYPVRERPLLACPITAFGGTDDPRTDPADLVAWKQQTTGDFRLAMIDGGHFFINHRAREVADEIAADLTRAQTKVGDGQ
ncbi:MAG TPA: alpha/beta fold hydrolase [Candidatus Limnocylindrales bacterium]|nr:alpha/beta fold hydrolase [Candidatus Limnocylindrales bacterium]